MVLTGYRDVLGGALQQDGGAGPLCCLPYGSDRVGCHVAAFDAEQAGQLASVRRQKHAAALDGGLR